jgi:hypothetical protein
VDNLLAGSLASGSLRATANWFQFDILRKRQTPAKLKESTPSKPPKLRALLHRRGGLLVMGPSCDLRDRLKA